MAGWTTWMKKSSARAWGVAASLLCLFAPLSSMYIFHHPFGNARYKEIVFGVFGLVVYLWPDHQREINLDQPEDEASR
jgi:hypothetical protein